MSSAVTRSASPPADPRPPLARTSLARLLAEGGGVLFGAITGIITARWLEPAGKGTLSTLLFVVNVLFFYACSLGLSDAATILRARRRLSLRDLFRASALPALASSTVGIVVSFSFASLLFRGEHPAAIDAVLVASLTLPVWVFYELFAGLLNSDEAFVFTSTVAVIGGAITAIATWGLVVLMDGGLVGAVAGSIAGPFVGLVLVTISLARRGALRMPRWDPSYTRAALRLGLPLQTSYLLIAMSQRFDQLMVYGISGQSSAGHYSVALTVGLLVTHAPTALSLASFPRVAHLEAGDVQQMTERLARMGLVGSTIIGGALALAAPFVIPFAFGDDYRSAILPSLILIVGGILWGQQWILSRSLAARGETGPMIRFFAANVLVMAALDLLLIPGLGVVGAALASVGGSIAGLALCLATYRKRSPDLQLGALIPTRRDAEDLLSYFRTLVSTTR